MESYESLLIPMNAYESLWVLIDPPCFVSCVLCSIPCPVCCVLCPVSCPVSCVLYTAFCVLCPVSCVLVSGSCLLFPVSCVLCSQSSTLCPVPWVLLDSYWRRFGSPLRESLRIPMVALEIWRERRFMGVACGPTVKNVGLSYESNFLCKAFKFCRCIICFPLNASLRDYPCSPRSISPRLEVHST